MTTVIGFARDGVVYMAADSQVSLCERPMPTVNKILRLPVGTRGAELLLAVAGDGALASLARRFLKFEGEPDLRDENDLVDFTDQLAICMGELAREHGALDEGRMAGMLLLGFAGRLWTVLHSNVVPHPDGLAAVGSGGDAALGAMDAMLAMGRVEQVGPADCVVKAVLIAIGRDVNSSAPVHVEVLHPAPPAAPSIEESSDQRSSGVIVRESPEGTGGGAGEPDGSVGAASAGAAGAGDRPADAPGSG